MEVHVLADDKVHKRGARISQLYFTQKLLHVHTAAVIYVGSDA